ncbi:MAG: thiamine pyrophosphate-binding protein [Bacillota bacterium]
MSSTVCAEMVAQAVKDEGVEHIFGVGGGHLWLWVDRMCRKDISLIHMRHEQSGAYAADGYARSSGKQGVCFGTAGPGMLNMVPGVSQAFLANSPMVALFGQHTLGEEGRGQCWQQGFATEVFPSITRYVRRVLDPSVAYYWTRRAFRDAIGYPPKPVGLEIPMDIAWAEVDDSLVIPYTPAAGNQGAALPAANPVLIEQAVNMLINSERPCLIAGDGVMWPNAGAELKELAELLQVPVHTRRSARGLFPESHPLAFRGRFQMGTVRQADLILVVGLRMDTIDGWGAWGEKGAVIQISESPDEINLSKNTEVEIIGNCKVVMRQIIDYARSVLKSPVVREEWIETLAEAKRQTPDKVAELANRYRDSEYIHPDTAGLEIAKVLDDSATVIYDSFGASTYLSDKLTANCGGTHLDTASQGGVGHSVGMAIGAQLARPGKPVFALIGDGGIGISGFDVETAVRYKLPIVYMIWNNSSWMGGMDHLYYGKNWEQLGPKNSIGWTIGPDVRYDKIFEPFGCHTERVTKIDQLAGAVERAYNSGKTAVIDVVADPRVTSTGFGGSPFEPINLGGWVIASLNHLNPELMPEAGRGIVWPDDKKGWHEGGL